MAKQQQKKKNKIFLQLYSLQTAVNDALMPIVQVV